MSPDTTVADATRILAEHHIGVLVVSGGGEMADSILSERDIVRSFGQRGTVCLQDRVEDMMTRDSSTCSRQATSDKMLEQMTDGHFRHMPVLDDDKLIGIVTIGDAVQARLQELSMEKNALEGMIKGY